MGRMVLPFPPLSERATLGQRGQQVKSGFGFLKSTRSLAVSRVRKVFLAFNARTKREIALAIAQQRQPSQQQRHSHGIGV